ncbi:hypothetical protein C8J57DRAFT_1533818 [Mycena rebaudengoi]|nr:hypothetical protein C8J57DRAFT_1533818 [Mycena rebaudengoi]
MAYEVVRRPQTCATIAVLDLFHILMLQAKTTANDFYAVLEKLMDHTGIKPPDRYLSFLHLAREYRHLQQMKCGGRGHTASGVEGTASGELAVLCPCCPRPKENIPDDFENAPEEEKFLHIQFFAFDVCFRLKRRLVSSELKDPGLGTGYAYMVEPAPYRQWLLRRQTRRRRMSTCSGLAALDFVNTKFSRGYAATGMGMGVCARHKFVQPNGVGDLQKGERYVNMDYIFASVMRHVDPRPLKIISYDIVCQWWKGLRGRLKKLPPLVRLSVVMDLLRFVIPKMHIHSHMLACQLSFSLNLIPGSAQTDGEGIERPWAMIGGVATSSCELGPGSRADILDDHWGHWNWTTLLGLGMGTSASCHNILIFGDSLEAFVTFSLQQQDCVPLWQEMVRKFEKDPKEPNLYAATIMGLTEAQVRLKFAAEEAEEEAKGVPSIHSVSPSTFIAVALDVEDEQRRLRVQVKLKKAKTTV